MSLCRSYGSWWVAVWAAAGLCACTASHDVGSSGQSLLAGSGSSGKDGGAGSGATGRAGSSGTVVAGSAARGAACGASCMGSNVLGIFDLPACCTPDGKCGLDTTSIMGPGCLEQNAPGTPDPSCPAGVLMSQGCCRPDGTCGAIDTLSNLGCTDNATGMVTRCTPPK
jgi:hypothetical protein